MLTEVPANIYSDPFLLYGKRVVVNSAFTPKMQLSEDVMVTDDFRKEINEWMIEFFGVRYLVPDDQILLVGDMFIMNPNAYKTFRQKLPFPVEVNNGRG
jgi:hypothetical protein